MDQLAQAAALLTSESSILLIADAYLKSATTKLSVPLPPLVQQAVPVVTPSTSVTTVYPFTTSLVMAIATHPV